MNGSCVVAGDFDNDGYTDLFVGTRSVVSSYGITPESVILWNNHNGQLISDNKLAVEGSLKLGMVTDASYLQKENKLVVVGEWMPIKILNLRGRSFGNHCS